MSKPAGFFAIILQLRSPPCLLLFFAVVAGSLGCQNAPSLSLFAASDASAFDDEQSYRNRFLAERGAEDIRWLMKHRVKNGMSRGDINRLIGIDGERILQDEEILGEGGHYRADDKAYSWGPDREGNVYVLVFRDDRLVNFENFN